MATKFLKGGHCPYPACYTAYPIHGKCGTGAAYDRDSFRFPCENASFVSPFKQQDMVSHSSLCSSWLLLCYCVFSRNDCVWSNVCLYVLMYVYIWMGGGWRMAGWMKTALSDSFPTINSLEYGILMRSSSVSFNF